MVVKVTLNIVLLGGCPNLAHNGRAVWQENDPNSQGLLKGQSKGRLIHQTSNLGLEKSNFGTLFVPMQKLCSKRGSRYGNASNWLVHHFNCH